MGDERDDVDWVELLRVHDRFQAEITVHFLEDHDVPVQTAGGPMTALPTISLTDVRLLVPRTHLERATQVLRAMRAENAEVHPFRDAPPEPYEPPVARHNTRFLGIVAALIAACALLAAISR